MKIDELLAIFADWLVWLKEQVAYYEGQLSKLDEKRRKAETVEPPADTSYFSTVFGEASRQAAVEQHTPAEIPPTNILDEEPPAPTVQPEKSPVEVKDEKPEPENKVDAQEVDLGEDDLA